MLTLVWTACTRNSPVPTKQLGDVKPSLKSLLHLLFHFFCKSYWQHYEEILHWGGGNSSLTNRLPEHSHSHWCYKVPSAKTSALGIHKWIKGMTLHPAHAFLRRLLQVLRPGSYSRSFSLSDLNTALVLCLVGNMDCCHVMPAKRSTYVMLMMLSWQDPDVPTGKHTEHTVRCFWCLIYDMSKNHFHYMLPIFGRRFAALGEPILLPITHTMVLTPNTSIT